MTIPDEQPLYGARVYRREGRIQVTRTIRRGTSDIDPMVR